GHLEIGEHLEEVSLEGLVRAVELVDEEDGRIRAGGFERGEDRALHEIRRREEVALERAFLRAPARLREADRHHLALHVPFVDGARDVEALVALQADERSAQSGGERLRELGLAGARFALEEERPGEAKRQEDGGGEPALGDVIRGGEERLRLLDRSDGAGPHSRREAGARRRSCHQAEATARRASTATRCARYSALACRSDCSSEGSIAIDSSAFGDHSRASACSIAFARKTPREPAPVTAARAPCAVCATKTPTMANRDAGLRNFTYAAFFGTGKVTDITSSPGASAVSKSPLKKSSAESWRLSVFTVAPRPRRAAG